VLIKMQETITYILRSIADFLQNHLRLNIGMGDTSAVGNIMQVLIVFTGVICVLIVLILAWSRMRNLRDQARLARRGAENGDERLDAAGWRTKAEEFYARGLLKEACRALYLSVIYVLDERKILEFSANRTNYEYWYALSGKHVLQKGFRQLADMIEVMWFGNHQAQSQDYEFCLSLVGMLTDEARALSESAGKSEAGAQG